MNPEDDTIPRPNPVPSPYAPPPVPVPEPQPHGYGEPAPAATPEPGALTPARAAFELAARIRQEIGKVFLGQTEVVDQVLASLFAGGHVLLEGKPGLGKTHLVLALARACGINFGRIQFTPDLLPTDVTGHTLYDMGSQRFQVRKGPVFTNLLLADEINRAPAKTQSALLEVMQERQVTIDGESIPLAPPFMAIATQNPIEQEGTYPLPEAQLDRFLMKVLIDYPEPAHEIAIVASVAAAAAGSGLNPGDVGQVCTGPDILAAQQATAEIQAVESVVAYAVNLARATRESAGISLGAGTRGAISLLRTGKAYAILAGRHFVSPDDIKRAVLPVLRHRIAVAPELAISGQDADSALRAIVGTVEAPR